MTANKKVKVKFQQSLIIVANGSRKGKKFEDINDSMYMNFEKMHIH